VNGPLDTVVAARIRCALTDCRRARFSRALELDQPAAFRAAHGYSYYPKRELRERQLELLNLRRQRARVRAQGGAA